MDKLKICTFIGASRDILSYVHLVFLDDSTALLSKSTRYPRVDLNVNHGLGDDNNAR